jgi:hypothetical protein
MNDATKVAIAIVGLAFVAVLVVNGSKTSAVIGSLTGGFSNSIKAAAKG